MVRFCEELLYLGECDIFYTTYNFFSPNLYETLELGYIEQSAFAVRI